MRFSLTAEGASRVAFDRLKRRGRDEISLVHRSPERRRLIHGDGLESIESGQNQLDPKLLHRPDASAYARSTISSATV